MDRRVLQNGAVEPSAPSQPSTDAQGAMCAVDCEMCYTAAGLEVTRVTVVNGSGEVRLPCLQVETTQGLFVRHM